MRRRSDHDPRGAADDAAVHDFACVLDGHGGARVVALDRGPPPISAAGLWVHLGARSPRAVAWWADEAGVERVDVERALREARLTQFLHRRGRYRLTLAGIDPRDDRVGDIVVWVEPTDALLQTLHERARAVHDTLAERANERTNRILYVLTLISAVFLPLSLVTAVLGVNVGIEGASLPGMEAKWTFAAMCLALVALAAGGGVVIRRRHLL